MLVTCGPRDNEQQVEISWPKDRNIGIMLSSGADSAVLLYMLCMGIIQEQEKPEVVIKGIFTIPKVDGAEQHSAKIVSWINKKLNLKLPPPTIDAPENLDKMLHTEQVAKSMIMFGQKYNINFGFVGDQQVVPEPYHIEGLYPQRYSKNPYPQYLGLPFLHLDKSHTIDLHYRLDTTDLLVLSHSCTQLKAGRCGRCYHCNERSWAFKRLEKTDPGTN